MKLNLICLFLAVLAISTSAFPAEEANVEAVAVAEPNSAENAEVPAPVTPASNVAEEEAEATTSKEAASKFGLSSEQKEEAKGILGTVLIVCLLISAVFVALQHFGICDKMSNYSKANGGAAEVSE